MSNTSLKSETDMGRVTTHVRIENASDHWRAHNGEIDQSDVRCVEVDDALIDTGCSSLAMPKRLIDQLGLQFLRARQVRGVGGLRESGVYSSVRIFIQGRDCILDVTEIDDGCPILIGQIPLEAMDFVVDLKNQKIIGNPDHDGEWIMEMYGVDA
jgi:predicted aspartyl protease